MKPRDRIVLTVLGVAGIMAALWFLAVAPKREEATAVKSKVTAAELRRDNAVAAAATAEQAKTTYQRDYATVARLGKAVPTKADVPSLVFQLETAAKAAKVDFRSISVGTESGVPAPAAAKPAAAPAAGTAAPATPAATGPATSTAGIEPKSFNFTFRGRFFELRRLLSEIDKFSRVKGSKVSVSGRLLTVDSVSLNPAPKGLPDVTAIIKANVYVAPIPSVLPGSSSAQANTAGTPTTSSQVAP